MSMLRREFLALPINTLKILIRANLDFIHDASPFRDTRKSITAVREQIDQESEMANLQAVLINLMSIVLYWDNHHDINGLFTAAEKKTVNEMLGNISVRSPGLSI